MGQPIPAQHPSVVLRSHFKLVRGLLAIAMVAVLALTAAVVILANDGDQITGGSTAAKPIESVTYGGFNPAAGRPDAAPAVQEPQVPAGVRYDGGPDEGTRGLNVQSQTAAGTRFDGGPEEGTRGPQPSSEASAYRSSYQPAPADTGGPRVIPQGPGSR